MEKRNVFRRFRNYMSANISAQVTGAVLVLLMLAGVILQLYVKNQYFDFLLKETRNTTQVRLLVSAENINNTLYEAVNTSCNIAIDGALLSVVDNARKSEDEYGRDMLTLFSNLNMLNNYSNNIAAAAIVTQDGLLEEYGKHWANSGYPNLWQGKKLEYLQTLYEDVMSLTEESGVVRYKVITEPLMHDNMKNMQLFHIGIPLLGRNSRWDKVESVVVLSFRLDTLFEVSASNNVKETLAKSYLSDGDGVIISHGNSEYIGMNVSDYQKMMGVNEELSQPLKYFGWTVYSTIDVAGMQKEVDKLYGQSILVYMVLLILCGIVWRFLLKRVLNPLNVIRDAMKNIQLSKNMPRIEVKGSHEVWQLAQHYNEMTDELEEQREQIRQYYKEKTKSIELRNKAEREALEAQINAHFLCNTLTAINYDAIENGDIEVAAHLKKLSGLLSYTFSRKLVYVTLGQEFQWVEQYLYLQKFRLMEVFDYTINFPEKYSEWPCCKLFLQPFVENSIIHGFEGRERGGEIHVSGSIVGGRFVLTVQDNGCGMDEKTEAVIQDILKKPQVLELDGTGIGIQNVVTRLRMYYGKELDISLETEQGKGTCFTFWLPIPKNSIEHPEITEEIE